MKILMRLDGKVKAYIHSNVDSGVPFYSHWKNEDAKMKDYFVLDSRWSAENHSYVFNLPVEIIDLFKLAKLDVLTQAYGLWSTHSSMPSLSRFQMYDTFDEAVLESVIAGEPLFHMKSTSRFYSKLFNFKHHHVHPMLYQTLTFAELSKLLERVN